jgi:hypothetical protein
MSTAIMTDQVTQKADITDKILPAMQTAVFNAATSYGWQLMTFPTQNMLIVNVPVTSGSNYQFAMNTITGAWTKFTGWNARCWELQGNTLYYGGTGIVGQAWVTNADNGMAISADCLPAFNKFGNDTQLKKFNMARPTLYSDGNPAILMGINLDYDQVTTPTGVLTAASSATGMIWGSMTWGSMVWGGTLQPIKNWQYAAGMGYAAALRIKATNNISELRWASTDYVFEPGGII